MEERGEVEETQNLLGADTLMEEENSDFGGKLNGVTYYDFGQFCRICTKGGSCSYHEIFL
jgi:hypothetical protein